VKKLTSFIARNGLRLGASALSVCLTTGSAVAQTLTGSAYPEKPVRIIVPFAPAGAGDLFARSVAQHLAEALGQQFIVDNRGGAGGTIGLGSAAKAPPDGYTLLLGNLGTLAINPSLYKEVPYDSLRSFAPVSLIGGTPLLLAVHASIPARSAKELFALARARPGALNYASAGSGGPTHLTMEIIKSQLGLDIVHVPFKGNVNAITSLVSGETHMMITTILTPLPHMRSGRLRGIAVTTLKRQPAVPEVPTLDESGLKGFDVSGWYGILAPAGTPLDVIAKLNNVIVRMMASPEVVGSFTRQGLEVFSSTPAQFTEKIRSEMPRWAKVVRDTRATVD
jgi:tripartite-type tricarboxylate transporter receptor subunit TctC